MARIDSITIGKGQGSLGNVTLRKTKDGTIASQKISKGTQKVGTYNQTVRRVMLSNLVNAYQKLQSLTDAGMKVAFTKKPSNESDFNAFIRMNMAKPSVSAVKLTKTEAAGNVVVPAPFILTDGDLLAPTGLINTFEVRGDFYTFSLGTNTNNMGAVSQALVNNWGLQNGDVVTFVAMMLSQSPIPFEVHQMVVDVDSTEDIPSWISTTGLIRMGVSAFAQAATIIRGRKNVNGYQVSSASLGDVDDVDFGDVTEYIMHTSETYEKTAVESYGYKENTFLQNGAFSGSDSPQPGPTPPSYYTLTLQLASEDAGTYTMNGEHTEVGEYVLPKGTEVVLHFDAAEGWSFGGWKSGETDPDISFVMNADMTKEAIVLED